MTSDDEVSPGERTAAAMHGTAAELEVAEAILHRSAERSPNTDTAARLHALGDQVTAQAHDIDRRADRLTTKPHQRRQPEPAAGFDEPRRDTAANGKRSRP
jgi:hypothetical protein